MSLESGKVNRQTPKGEIFDVQLTPDAARELKSKNEAEIRTVIVKDMQRVFPQETPTFSRSVTEFRSFYWPYGTPDTTPGWAEKVKAYYRDLPVKSCVFLAGDRLAVGATEGAATSGATAAKLVQRAYTKRNS